VIGSKAPVVISGYAQVMAGSNRRVVVAFFLALGDVYHYAAPSKPID
jgi:hypothetical protein